MRPGDLDRSIVIQQRTGPVQDEFGEETYTWVNIHTSPTIPAKVTAIGGSDRFVAQQVVEKQMRTFRIRYRSVTTLHRVVYSGLFWDITDVRELGRREGLEIDATARAD